MSSLREPLLRWMYRVGWRVGPLTPAPVRAAVASVSARAAMLSQPAGLSMLRHNLSVATGKPADPVLLQAAVRSYVRNLLEVFALPGWTPEAIVDRVVTSGEEHLRTAYAGSGAVVALPHSGNWDLAGAWACLTGMPVTTVAERLPAEEFSAYLRFRRRLGMEVVAHDEPASMAKLAAAVRAGRLVCLVADRDLSGTGLPVRWGSAGVHVRMPAGPAMVARRSGAALVPAVCSYTGDQLSISFGAPIAAAPGRAGLTAMTQQVADFFAERIAEHPEDWHMFQSIFLSAEPT